jgi:hypothetical protein
MSVRKAPKLEPVRHDRQVSEEELEFCLTWMQGWKNDGSALKVRITRRFVHCKFLVKKVSLSGAGQTASVISCIIVRLLPQ